MLNARFFCNALLTFLLAIALAAPLPTSLADAPGPIPQSTVGPVPDGLHDRLNLSPFYQQHLDVRGLPVLGSAKVSKYALLEAAYLVEQTLGHRPDILKAMAENKVR